MQKIKAVPKKIAPASEKNSDKDLIETSNNPAGNKGSFFSKHVPMLTKKFSISHELTQQLQAFVEKEETTIFIAMLEVLHVLFYRYNNTENDILVGVPNTPTFQPGEGHPIVLFKDLLPVSNKLNSENSFLELLNEIKTNLPKASAEYNGSPYEFEDETIIKKKDLRLTPPSHVMLVVESLEENFTTQVGLLQLSGEPLTLGLSMPELQFFIKETVDGLIGTIEYNAELYSEARIDRTVNHFNELLVSIMQSPTAKVSKYNILTAEEKNQLFVTFNDTKTEYPRDKTLVNLFEEQVSINGDKVAVVFENEKLTYDELNKRSNQVAWCLLEHGVKTEALVPIFIERSIEMLIGILGILKAGAAYVPIDPEYPEDRINFMLEDTAATIVISSKISSLKLPASAAIDIIEIDKCRGAISDMPVQNPRIEINSLNLAYVIYTSGSTGKPKGVMIEHQAVVDHCFGLIKVAQLENYTSFALFSPLVFDAGHSIIFTSLLLGATLNILSRELIMDGEKLVSYLEKNPVDCIKIVPSVWLSYINSGNKVLAKKAMIFGGESFSLKIQEHLLKLNYAGAIYNHYGPTETTIGKCIHKVDLQKIYKTVPIGKPFSNTQLYVVDISGELVPVETDGELYISGEGIARGYLNRPELTVEKFIENSFHDIKLFVSNDENISNAANAKFALVYKTGDKVRWNMDGEIEYIGRIDDQVKINGYRIELAEIENVLLQNKNIRQASVRLCEDDNRNKILVGYVVPEEPFNKQKTIAQLQEKLPDYMIPGMWMELDHLPLTSNGKIDKKALPVPEFSELLKKQYAPPVNDIEKSLAKIWENLLGIEKVGVYDTFFELGGNSIQTVTMFSRVRKQFGRELPLATIFQAPDISKLASIISQKKNVINLSCLVPIQPQGDNPPLFCMHAGAGNVLFYNDLAKNLGISQPLYGLMARGLNGKEHFHTSIEEMATHYIKEIKSVQPAGPYFLAGYCLGGTIAFEMAQQLLKEGEKVELLATFNSRSSTYLNAPSADDKIPQRKPSLKSVISAHAGNFSSLNSKEKLLYPLKVIKIGSKLTTHILYKKTRNKILRINNRITKMGFDYYLSRGRLLPKLLRNKYLLHTNGYMSRAYKPEVYPGKMIIFRSPQIYYDRYLGWNDHVSGGVESYDVPGIYTRRSKIMTKPFVDVISAKLKTILKS
ncbi:MAG: amino acid adenylation domain-containing protein [Bacteroidota bacterium]|nr:amino acid adenylation domain-containing protein [Bacteroidota bacterium]